MLLFSAPIRRQFKSELVLAQGVIDCHGVLEYSDSLKAEQAADFIGLHSHKLFASLLD